MPVWDWEIEIQMFKTSLTLKYIKVDFQKFRLSRAANEIDGSCECSTF